MQCDRSRSAYQAINGWERLGSSLKDSSTAWTIGNNSEMKHIKSFLFIATSTVRKVLGKNPCVMHMKSLKPPSVTSASKLGLCIGTFLVRIISSFLLSYDTLDILFLVYSNFCRNRIFIILFPQKFLLTTHK